MTSYLITGSSGGLGLAIVTQLAGASPTEVSHVFATARKRTPALGDLVDRFSDRVVFIALDVTDNASCNKTAEEVERITGDHGLDVLINNAAINIRDGADRMNDLELTLNSNVIGVRNVTRALVPLLQKSKVKKVVNISSALGSITLTPVFSFAPGAAYKVSKAALNMLTRQYAVAYANDGITFIAISPGYIKTRMGDKDGADLLPETAAAGVLKAANKASHKDSGKFFDIEVPGFEMNGRKKYSGGELPW